MLTDSSAYFISLCKTISEIAGEKEQETLFLLHPLQNSLYPSIACGHLHKHHLSSSSGREAVHTIFPLPAHSVWFGPTTTQIRRL